MKLRRHADEDAIPRVAVLGVLSDNGIRARHLGEGRVEIELDGFIEFYDLPNQVPGLMVARIARLTGIGIEKFHYFSKFH